MKYALFANDKRVLWAITLLTFVELFTGCDGAPENDIAVQDLNPGGYQVTILQGVGNDNRSDYPILNAGDGNPNTFMTTNSLSIGDVKWISFELSNPTNLSQINFSDDYTNDYNMGDLEVFVSRDSTDGVDGNWIAVGALKSTNHGFVDGEGSLSIVPVARVKWVQLVMTYSGTGAYGSSPSFYLTEISFN